MILFVAFLWGFGQSSIETGFYAFLYILCVVYHLVFYFSLSAFSPVSPDAWQFFRVSGSLKALSIMTFGT